MTCFHGLPRYGCAICNKALLAREAFHPMRRDEAIGVSTGNLGSNAMRALACDGSRRGTWKPHTAQMVRNAFREFLPEVPVDPYVIKRAAASTRDEAPRCKHAGPVPVGMYCKVCKPAFTHE